MLDLSKTAPSREDFKYLEMLEFASTVVPRGLLHLTLLKPNLQGTRPCLDASNILGVFKVSALHAAYSRVSAIHCAPQLLCLNLS